MSDEIAGTEGAASWPGDDLSSMDRQDLEALGRTLMTELKKLKAARALAVSRTQAVVDERARRRDLDLAETYEQRRRNAVAAGAEPPSPFSIPPAVTSAARRLRDLPPRIVLTSPGGEVQAAMPDSGIEVVVSDHAIVRYMERAMGVDIAAVRRRIATPVVYDAVAAGLRHVRTAEGVVICREGVVTSFLPRRGRARTRVRTGRKPRNARLPVDVDHEV